MFKSPLSPNKNRDFFDKLCKTAEGFFPSAVLRLGGGQTTRLGASLPARMSES